MITLAEQSAEAQRAHGESSATHNGSRAASSMPALPNTSCWCRRRWCTRSCAWMLSSASCRSSRPRSSLSRKVYPGNAPLDAFPLSFP
jgi:hypothetical protein